MFDTEDEEIGDAEKRNCQSCLVICDPNDALACLYLKLPQKQTPKVDGNQQTHKVDGNHEAEINLEDSGTSMQSMPPCRGVRHVDGQCALCIDNYEEGDEVTWSDLDCTHAFHKECILQWLSKGKKRCPVCRHWFVPGARIEEQKKAHGEAWERALAEIERREKEEESAEQCIDRRQQQEKLAHESREQESSESTEPTNFTEISTSNQHHQGQCDSVGTISRSIEEDLPQRKCSEESDIDGMQSDVDEAIATIIAEPSEGRMEMDDLENQLVTSNDVQE
jgi:hypothetical protein